MTDPFRSSEDYELFLYSLAETFPSIRRSTVTFVRRGHSLARVSGEIFFGHEIRLVILERVIFDRSPLTLDGYGHTTQVDPSSCIDRAVTAYLIRPATARRQTCHADRQPFDPHFGNPLSSPPVVP